ncbi:MAG TPA: bacillithiol biosynthesis cysteine-adding enzyme BshC, partial [Bacteroidetes bacterium]|nr:bacillithiol biosynthesis cysteine-adding enzyme BshC [Bacteroidota bacterium]
WHFSEPQDFVQVARQIRAKNYPRSEVVSVLRAQNEGLEAGPATFDHLNLLENPDSCAVVGGQQPGLFGGPLYTLYKALTILKLANALSSRLSCPVLPVFWIASDDHDFREVNHTFFPDQQGQPYKLEDSRKGFLDSRLPLAQVPLGENVGALVEEFFSRTPATDFSGELRQAIENCYRRDISYPVAFGRWLHRLLRPYGIITVDPSDARLKRLAVPLFRWEIEKGSPVTRAVQKQTERLKQRGIRPQIDLHDHLLNLFYHAPERESLVLADDGKITAKNLGKTFSVVELVSLLEEHPERFSPNVALRPLFQDTLFPTLAMVLGPSELHYFAQLTLAYREAGIPMPVAFPRASLTLIEPRAGRVLRKYSISLLDLFHERERLIELLAKKEVPDSLFSSLHAAKEMVASVWEKIARELAEFDPNLQKPAEIARGRSVGQFDFLEKKLTQAAKKRNEILRVQVEKLLNLVFPLGKPQERVYGILPYLARYGLGLVDALFSHTDIFATEHQVVELSAISEEDR